MIVKGLVLYQPYAWAMFHGKDVENRKVRTNHRGPLVIIAAKSTPTPKFVEGMLELRKRGLEAKDAELRTGGILGAVEIWDVEPPVHKAPLLTRRLHWHFPDHWGWLARKPVELPFRQYRGHQGIVNVEITSDEEHLLRKGGLLAAQ